MDVIVLFPPEPATEYLVWGIDQFGFIFVLEI
jgi:hypothetical protein